MAKSGGGKSRVIGGKFSSTGKVEDHNANRALVTRLVGEIGPDGANMLDVDSRIFLSDTRHKLSDGTASMFGWRQVQEVVRLHALVIQMRHDLDPSILNAPPFVQALARVQLERGRAVALHGPLKSGPGRWERLISEEYQEVMDELAVIGCLRKDGPQFTHDTAVECAISELAQLAQLCMGVIELLQQGKVEEEV